MTQFSLKELEARVALRATAADPSSYTAALVAKGMPKVAQKLGEEAVETVIAALGTDKDALTGEIADLLYHLMVLMHLSDIPLARVEAELQRRTAQTGLEEKAQRGAG